MSDYNDTTYRVIVIEDPEVVGQTAATPELAKLVAPPIDPRSGFRFGLERTDWGDHYGKPRPIRTVLIEAENKAGEWGNIGRHA